MYASCEEKPAAFTPGTGVLLPHRSDGRTVGLREENKFQSFVVLLVLEKPVCLQTHKQVSQFFPFFISHYDATTCATKNADSPLVLGVQPGLAGARRAILALPEPESQVACPWRPAVPSGNPPAH
jgi:hypothetical protein